MTRTIASESDMQRLLGFAMAAMAVAFGPTQAADSTTPLDILAFGDSLVQGYGLGEGKTFPGQLEAALRAAGHDARVTNAGSSGDTSETGAARLDWVMQDSTDAVIVVLGANDALRGIDPTVTRHNLNAVMATLADAGMPVLLAGMKAPRNMGESYVERFDAIYPELAKRYDAVFYPFYLKGVAQRPALNQPDGIHPNAKGVKVIVQNMLPKVEDLIARAKAAADSGS